MSESTIRAGVIRPSVSAKTTQQDLRQAIFGRFEILVHEIGLRVAVFEEEKGINVATAQQIREIALGIIYEEIKSGNTALRYLKGADISKIEKIAGCIGKYLMEEGFLLDKINFKELRAAENPMQSLLDASNETMRIWMNEIREIVFKINIAPGKSNKPKAGGRKSRIKQSSKLRIFKERLGIEKQSISYIRISKVTIPAETRKAVLREISSIRDAIYAKAYFDLMPSSEIYGIVKTRLYDSINSSDSVLFCLKNCTNAEKNKIAKYIAGTITDMVDCLRRAQIGRYEFMYLMNRKLECDKNIDELLLNIDMKTKVKATGSKLRRTRARRAGVDFEKLFKARRAGKTIKVRVTKTPKI